jgi:molybdopterin synthase sulfur carrier subunit
MTVTFRLTGFLRSFAAGAEAVRVEVQGETLRDALSAHPGVRDRVLDEQGELRRHVNVFVGADSVRATGGLATVLRDGAEISILAAVSGG